MVEVQSALTGLTKSSADQWLYTSTKNTLDGRLHSYLHYFTLKVSEYLLSNKAVELHFLVLPCLKSDIQGPFVSKNGTMSEDVLQKLIYNYYI